MNDQTMGAPHRRWMLVVVCAAVFMSSLFMLGISALALLAVAALGPTRARGEDPGLALAPEA